MEKKSGDIDIFGRIYEGVWTNRSEGKIDWGHFFLFPEEDGRGIIWDMYRNDLFEADVTNLCLVKNNSELEFVKRYKNPPANLTKADIFYGGLVDTEVRAVEGIWKIKSNLEEGVHRERSGDFFMIQSGSDLKSHQHYNRRELRQYLGNFWQRIMRENFKKRFSGRQQSLPFTSLIPEKFILSFFHTE